MLLALGILLVVALVLERVDARQVLALFAALGLAILLSSRHMAVWRAAETLGRTLVGLTTLLVIEDIMNAWRKGSQGTAIGGNQGQPAGCPLERWQWWRLHLSFFLL